MKVLFTRRFGSELAHRHQDLGEARHATRKRVIEKIAQRKPTSPAL